MEFFKEFEIAQAEVFQWIRDEYRLHRMPTRRQRDVDAVNGDTWYKNYQIKECQTSNKSSFCNGFHVKHEQQMEKEEHAPEISELFDELDKKDKPTWSGGDGEKLHSPTHRADAGRINDKNMKLDQLFPVSDRRELSGSNYSPGQLNVEARLSAKQFWAKQQNAIHEIELKHQHLNDGNAKPLDLSENQLRATSSNGNFPPFTFNLDTSSDGDTKRSSVNGLNGHQQQQQLDDDQLDPMKKNDLFDELDQKLSKQEQQGLQMLHRVKRRDISAAVINRLMTQKNFDEFMKSDGEESN